MHRFGTNDQHGLVFIKVQVMTGKTHHSQKQGSSRIWRYLLRESTFGNYLVLVSQVRQNCGLLVYSMLIAHANIFCDKIMALLSI